MQFCTVVARNYLAYARVLAESVTKQHPDTRLAVLVLDDVDCSVDSRAEPFDVVRPGDLGIEPLEFHRMAAIYDVLELATAVKPWLMSLLLERHPTVCYLDPDIEVFQPLDELDALARRSGIVLTPHTTSPLPRDGLVPGEREILLAGVYNLGFLALSRDAEPFLGWWSERLRRDCRNAQHDGVFVDQRWVDLVPGYFEHAICVDPGVNVAYWNLPSRRVKRSLIGYEVNGRPLQFFHFSGFDPLRPHILTKHQVGELRIRLEEHPAVAALCQAYARKLIDAGYLDTATKPYRYAYTSSGVPIDARMRRLYREALLDDERHGRAPGVPDAFEPAGPDRFMEWLAEPVAGGPGGISRYVKSVYDERADLRSAFDDLDGPDGRSFAAWMAKHGRTQAALSPYFVPMAAHPDRVRGGARAVPVAGPDVGPVVSVVGYLQAENGVGQVARGVIDTLRVADLSYRAVPCTHTPSRQLAPVDLSDALDAAGGASDVSVVCVNADELPMLRERLETVVPAARYQVGVWAWELESFPAWMARSQCLVDEVWVYSAHAAAAVEPMVHVPVHVFPPPIPIPTAPQPSERRVLASRDGFLVLFCFDFFSISARKNPHAVIDAYRRAFGPLDGARLVVKTVNGASFPVELAQLQARAEDRPDIAVIDGYARAEVQLELMQTCDCYISLHRAEGYGLTMAEAMALGKPVIATGYSGNLEFMTDDTGILVPYELVAVPVGCGPYPPSARWAEADVEAAADALRLLASDTAYARELGRRAREHIESNHGPASRAEWLRTRIEDVSGR